MQHAAKHAKRHHFEEQLLPSWFAFRLHDTYPFDILNEVQVLQTGPLDVSEGGIAMAMVSQARSRVNQLRLRGSIGNDRMG